MKRVLDTKNQGSMRIFFLVLFFLFCSSRPAEVQFQDLRTFPTTGQDPVADLDSFGNGQNSSFSAFGDYDRDGDLDIYVVNDGAPNALYRNELCSFEDTCQGVGELLARTRTLSFTKMTVPENPELALLRDGVSSSKFAKWIDYDKDGDLDLYLVNDGMNRLFINNLFTVENPFDPFSDTSIRFQLNAADSFSYKVHPELQLQMSSEDDMVVVTSILTQAVGGIPFPKVGTLDVFEDPTIDFLLLSSKPAPGMYLEIVEGADPGIVGNRYTILEVLGPTSLRLESEEDLAPIFRYSILSDSKYLQQNVDEFVNLFSSEGDVVQNSLLYELKVADENFSLVNEQVAAGDQLIVQSIEGEVGATLSNFLQVDSQSFAITPPPDLGSGTIIDNFSFGVRRKNGEVLLQKFFQDLSLQVQNAAIQAGDEVLIRSGPNTGKRFLIEAVGANGIVFLDSSPGSIEVTDDPDPILYEFIYNSMDIRIERIFQDAGNLFGSTAFGREGGGDANTRMVKVGDQILLQPDLGVNIPGETNTAKSESEILGTRSTFNDGSPRPFGRIEILEIIDGDEIILDAFPSEVIPGISNQDFPYQILHQSGRLKFDLNSGLIQFFDEAAVQPAVPRDFIGSLSLLLTDGNPNNPSIILSNVRPGSTDAVPLKLDLNKFAGRPVDSYSNNNIELSQSLSAEDVSTTSNLEYRPVYLGLGTDDPYADEVKTLRVFGPLPPGTTTGHEVFLRSFTDTAGTPQVLNFQTRILEITGDDLLRNLTVEKKLPDNLVTEFQTLCSSPANPCQPPPGLQESRDQFFADGTQAQLSVEYEFITTTAIEFGQRLDFGVSARVTLTTTGFSLAQLQVSTGDSILFKDPLGNLLFSSQIQSPVSSLEFRLENIDGAIDGSIAPFNQDYLKGSFGVFPVYAGTLLDFRRIERSTPSTDFTSLARVEDRLTFYSINAGKGLTEVATVPIGTVSKNVIQLRRALTLDPNLVGLDLSQVSTNPFYFRFVRSTGELNALPAFVDRRAGMNFQNRIKTNPDNSVRGIALLDVYRTSTKIEDKLYKRFRLKSLISNNVIELFPGTLDRAADTFDQYFYEITEVIRENGGIIENHTGNGVFAEAGDWNSDGILDLYLLNRATDETQTTLEENRSVLLYGSNQASVLTTGFTFQTPASPPSDKDNELLNLPSQSPVTKFLSSKMVIGEDFDGDQNDDLLILNESDPDRLFVSRPIEGAVDRELYSRFAADAAEPGELDGLNSLVSLTRMKPGLRGASVGDINGDGSLDFYFFSGNEVSSLIRNQLFLREGEVYTALELPINDSLVNSMETGNSYWSDFIDMDNDGFVDISVLNADKHYLASPRLRGKLSEGGSSVKDVGVCGASEEGLNRHIQWGDLNLDGYDDFYISRGGTFVETNILCISQPSSKELTANHFFVFEILPRDLSSRSVENPTRDIHGGTLILTDVTDPTGPNSSIFNRNFDYRYPMPVEVRVGTGTASQVSVTVVWGEDSTYNYGTVSSSLITGKKKVLLQPDDFPILKAKEVFSSSSSPASTALTTVGPKTTNIEVTGFTLLGGSREALTVESMALFITGTNLGDSASVLEQGLIPKGSVKLYMDGSEGDVNSDDYTSWTPDGRFNLEHDVLLSTALLDDFAVTANIYPELLDAKGKVVTAEGRQVVRAKFQNIVYRSRDGSSVTSIVINPAKDGQPAQRASFLAVVTIDVSGDFQDLAIEVLPFIPVRIDGGQVAAMEQTILGGVVPNITAFLASPFNRTNEVSLRGNESGQLHKSVSIDTSQLGSRDATTLTTFPRSLLSFPPIQNLTGVLTRVDQKEPVAPALSVCPGANSTPVLINRVVTALCGKAEPLSFIQIDNSVSGQKITTQSDPTGFWEVELSGLREGENPLDLVSIDLFGNASTELKHIITVDISAPLVTNVVVTNVGIHKATVSWNTSEGSIGFVSLSSLENPNVVQVFNEQSQVNFTTEHFIIAGRTNSLFGGIRSDGTLPTVCHVSVLDADLQALCPGSTYIVSISVRDQLGNEALFSDQLSFQTQTLVEQTGTRDLDGDGVVDLDSDGDGIPNSIEVDSRFPDLDVFDPTDGLLDFDGDGVSNVEEFQSGQDMYNPFDILPIANAGSDQIVDPGVVLLDGTSSNLNGGTTASVIFNWTLESVPGGLSATSPTIFDSNKQKANFIGLFPGVYRVGLSIETSLGIVSKKDEASITIRNIGPTADAGKDSLEQVDQTIILDGSQSFDPNGEDLTFIWVQLSGPRLGTGSGIENFRAAKTSFTTERTGIYEFELIVRDPSGVESRDQVEIRVNSDVEVFPIADAGPDLVTSVGLPVTLQGDRSGGAAISSNLLYFWELITDSTRDIPPGCENLATSDGLFVSPGSSNLSNPSVTFNKAGIFGFFLKVQEEGKGIFSASDCVRVIVNEAASLLPISRPRIFGTPAPFSQNTAQSRSKIRKSIQPNQEISSIFRAPVRYEIEMSGLDSYPDHDTISASAGSVFQQAVATDDCKLLNSVYRWRQTAGTPVSLHPVVRDCSIVKFVPIKPGIHSFELSVNQVKSGDVLSSLARKIIIVVNDPDDQVSGSNNFVPSVQAPPDAVVQLAQLTLPESPKCIDPDLVAAASIINNPVGEHTLSQTDLLPCTSLPGLECIWRQIDGPPALIENNRQCIFTANPKKAGTYTFGVTVNDGTYTSLEDEMSIVILQNGQTIPRAHAGFDQNAGVNETVILDGSFSTASGGGFSYLWSQTKGMPILLQNSSTQSPAFIPPAEDSYEFQLQIKNSKGIISLPDRVGVRVSSLLNTGPGDPDPIETNREFELQGGGGGGGCFIATAASGSHHSWLVQRLSWFRDEVLLQSAFGRTIVGAYYHYSPMLANGIKSSPVLQFVVSLFLYPIALVLCTDAIWLLPLLLLMLTLPRKKYISTK